MEYCTSIKKYLFLIIIVAFFTAPLSLYAQNTERSENVSNQQQGNTQTFTPNTQSPDSVNLNNSSGAAAQGLVSCSIGAILGNITQQALSSLVGQAAGQITNIAETKVPVKNVTLEQAQTGVTIPGTSIPIFPSWDAIGFCLVNTIIDYIGQATVEWINRGFPDGGPVFVQNPGLFIQGVGDYEAGRFVGELTDDLLCSPFALDVRTNITTGHTRTYQQRAQCTFSNQKQNMGRFLSGDTFSFDDWLSVTQNPANNPYGAEELAKAELQMRIINSQGQQIKLLDWGRGFLTFKDPETGNISTPGSVIEKQVNNRLNNPNQRLLIADEFDEIVTALVNQLVRIAVDELTQIGQ